MATILDFAVLALMPVLQIASSVQADDQRVAFPAARPAGGSFSHPEPEEVLDVSPPGFSWWRAAKNGQATYVLKVTNESGTEVYRSPQLNDPVHVPEKAFPQRAILVVRRGG